MAGGAPNMDQFELYFKRADLDHDGRITGAEAVSFFQASGLPKPVLAQIWAHADQNRAGFLGRAEFYNALKLVTVAQSKKDLTPDLVKAALYGPASTKIPAPQINLGALPAPQSNPNAGPPVASAPAVSPSINPRGPQGYPAQQTQAVPPHVLPHVQPLPNTTFAASGWTQPRPQGPTILSQNGASKPNGPTFAASGAAGAKDSSASVTGNGFVPSSAFGDNSLAPKPSPSGLNVSSQLPNKPSQPGQNQQMQSTFKQNQQIPVQNSSAFPARVENVPSSQSLQPWPKMTQSNVQKYTKVFMEVDTDRDGKITGEQARTLFLSWKLPREILKQVWDLSDQDNDSMLSLKEFCIALYLMERFREGHPLPRALPPGIMSEGSPLPPSGQAPATYGAPVWRPPSGVQQAHRMPGQRQVTPAAAARPPRPVPVPLPASDEDVQPRQQKPRVPVLEKHLIDQLSNEEQSALNSKFQEASEADKKVAELEKDILEAKQKIEFYRSKMQEIVLYKSRCDTRLNEITERVSADRREVESLSKKYEDKYKQSGDVASKLSIEEATFRDIQEKKMELYRAIVKLEQDGKPEDIQARVDRIQADLEEQVKALNERCKMYGLRGKPISVLELPFGWQPGIQEGAADWDENWDKLEDEGFIFVKELTLDVQNVIAPPKPKSLPVQNKSTFQDESATTVSSSDKNNNNNDNNDGTSNDELTEQNKDKSLKTPPDSPLSRTESPSKIFKDFPAEKIANEDSSPRTIKTQSESMFLDDRIFDEPAKATFDSHYDSDAAWDFNATKHKDMDQESFHENSLFDSDGWGLNPIRTTTDIPKINTFKFDSVPSTPAYSYSGSPPGHNLFQNPMGPGTGTGPFASAFADSVPTTPAYSYTASPRGAPFASPFADSVPSTPMNLFSPEDHSFNNFSRFDSFSSTTTNNNNNNNPRDSFSRFDSFSSSSNNNPRDAFSRFDSFRSTAQDSEHDPGFYASQNLARFDSMRSTADSDFGHSLFQPRESDYNRGFPSHDTFDDADPFGSHDPFKTSVESETPRRDSVDGWKAF